MKPLRIYLAGAMTSSHPITFLDNLRKGMRATAELIVYGDGRYAVFSPFIDFSIFFQLREGEQITVDMIKAQSMAWLEVSDCVLVLPEWGESQGTIAEIKRAHELKIPVFFNRGQLDAHDLQLRRQESAGGGMAYVEQ